MPEFELHSAYWKLLDLNLCDLSNEQMWLRSTCSRIEVSFGSDPLPFVEYAAETDTLFFRNMTGP